MPLAELFVVVFPSSGRRQILQAVGMIERSGLGEKEAGWEGDKPSWRLGCLAGDGAAMVGS
jgi:hypothetical protein